MLYNLVKYVFVTLQIIWREKSHLFLNDVKVRLTHGWLRNDLLKVTDCLLTGSNFL